jgi:membrane protein
MGKKPTLAKDAIVEIGEATFKKIIAPFYIGGAAELAFWLLLSLAPASILLAQILNLFTFSMEAAKEILETYVAGELSELIAPLLEYNPNKSVTVLLIILAAFAGSSVVFTLMRIINRAYGTVPKTGNPIMWIIRERLRSLLMTLLVIVTMVFALYILVFGELFAQAAFSFNGVILGREFTFSEVWYGIRWAVAFALFFFMVFSLYNILPRLGADYGKGRPPGKLPAVKHVLSSWLKNRKSALRSSLPGSIFAAVLMLVATRLYTLYIRNMTFDNFNILYGGLSSVVVLLLWFYIISYIVITGVQLNAAYSEYIGIHGGK